MQAIAFTLIPVVAVLIGSLFAVLRRPSDALVSAMQHLAAGVVFTATAAEILPQGMHEALPSATFTGLVFVAGERVAVASAYRSAAVHIRQLLPAIQT